MRKKRRSGISLAVLLLALLPAAAANKKNSAESYALVGGTVFQDAGYALPNAEVTLIPNAQTGGASVKLKKLEAISNSRGEFAFRVPPAAMQYTVKVAARGYRAAEKSVAVEGEAHIDVTFQLEPESK